MTTERITVIDESGRVRTRVTVAPAVLPRSRQGDAGIRTPLSRLCGDAGLRLRPRLRPERLQKLVEPYAPARGMGRARLDALRQVSQQTRRRAAAPRVVEARGGEFILGGGAQTDARDRRSRGRLRARPRMAKKPVKAAAPKKPSSRGATGKNAKPAEGSLAHPPTPAGKRAEQLCAGAPNGFSVAAAVNANDQTLPRSS